MPQSDFLIRAGANSAAGNLHTGSALFNNSLSNPLTSSTHCRVLNEENSNANYPIRGLYFVSSSVSNGQFVNIPETKSVSLRIWGRANVQNGNCRVGLLAKHNGFNVADLDSGVNPITGYEFGFRPESYYGDALYYKFAGYNTAAGSIWMNPIPGFSGGAFSVTNKWIGLRMDIVPVRAVQIINGTPTNAIYKDIVSFYTASVNAPDSWTQIGNNYELLAQGTSGFVPWGSYSTSGSPYRAGTVATSSYGFYVGGFQNDGSRTYFDDFQIIVEDAF